MACVSVCNGLKLVRRGKLVPKKDNHGIILAEGKSIILCILFLPKLLDQDFPRICKIPELRTNGEHKCASDHPGTKAR